MSGTDVDTVDTTIVEVEILDTDEFKTLVAFEEEVPLVVDRSSRKLSMPGERPDNNTRGITSADSMLSKTEQFEQAQVTEDEEDAGFDPYDHGVQE